MSLATNQATCMLAVCSGCMDTLQVNGIAPEVLPTVVYTKEIADEAIIKYPATGHPKKNLKWMQDKVIAWNAYVLNLSPEWTTIVLVQMSLLALDDLLGKLRNPMAVQLVKPVHEALMGLSDQLDPKGDKYEAYEEANNLLSRFYSILEFQP